MLTRLAFLYVPIIAVSIAGACLWAFCLLVASRGGKDASEADVRDYLQWQKWYLESLKYDLKFAELVMAVVVGFIGVLALFALVFYVVRRWCGGNYQEAGRGAQRWMAVILICCPPLLVGAGALIVWHNRTQVWSNTESNILHIYALSMLRVTPYLTFFGTGIGVVLAVAADVVFFLLPPSHPLSIQGATTKRLRILLDHLGAVSGNKVLVIAHSQGSVIAVTTLDGSDAQVELVTLGSPIDSLYRCFLDWHLGHAPAVWANYYRYGDYIAGKIHSVPPADFPLGEIPGAPPAPVPKGGHVNYWSDRAIMKAVLKLG